MRQVCHSFDADCAEMPGHASWEVVPEREDQDPLSPVALSARSSLDLESLREGSAVCALVSCRRVPLHQAVLALGCVKGSSADLLAADEMLGSC